MIRYELFDEVYFRSPLFSIEGLAEDVSLDEKKILELLSDESFRLGLYIASPELLAEVDKFRNGVPLNQKDKDRLISSILTYWVRMSMRSTPFGTFAGSYTVNIDNSTNIIVDDIGNHRNFTRLDMNLLCELSHVIASDVSIRKDLMYQVNNSLYEIAGNFRYVEYTQDGIDRKYFVREVEGDELLADIISKTRSSVHYNDLISIIQQHDVSHEEAESFLNILIENQIILSSISASVTGPDFLTIIIEQIQGLKSAIKFVKPLKEVQSILSSSRLTIEGHNRIEEILKTLLADVKAKNLVQTDLSIATKASTISRKVLEEIRDNVEGIYPLCAHISLPRMTTFVEKFSERFEGREVPLQFALDTEVGVGYDRDSNEATDIPVLLSDIPFREKSAPRQIEMDPLTKFKLSKLVNGNRKEIEFTDEDIDRLKNKDFARQLAESIYVHGTIFSNSNADLDNGRFTFLLRVVNGPSASRLIGRFCFGDESVATNAVKYCRAEESLHPEYIFAEVAHLPQQRVGNVVARPHLRNYEIPYLSFSHLDTDHQIPVSDLYVSVRNSQVILRSRKLNKRVMPRLTNAHFYGLENLPVYKFICDLQTQSTINANPWGFEQFDWVEFIPRVVYKKLILSRAQWNFVLPNQIWVSKDVALFETLLDSFIERNQVPSRVILAESDHELLVDLRNNVSRSSVLKTLKKDGRIKLTEDLSTPDQCFVVDSANRKYTSEVVIPLRKIVPTFNDQLYERTAVNDSERTLMVGSKCLYLKIYCGTVTADKLISDVIYDTAQLLVGDGKINYWFFIRYFDPDQHLRVRFFGDGRFWYKVTELLNKKLAPYLETGVVQKIQIDTYKRELDRYGIMPIEFSERIFHLNSISTSQFLKSSLAAGEDVRWLFAMKAIDTQLDTFGIQFDDKVSLLNLLSEGFHREFDSDKTLKRHVDMSYRARKNEIFKFFSDEPVERLKDLVPIIDQEISGIETLIGDFNYSSHRHDWLELKSLMSSYIHMFINRLYRSNQRKLEYIIYSFLAEYYNSKKAISSKLAGEVGSKFK